MLMLPPPCLDRPRVVNCSTWPTPTERWKALFVLAIVGCGCDQQLPMYRPNIDVRRSFSALTEGDVIAAEVDGCSISSRQDIRNIVSALQRSEWRAVDAHGKPHTPSPLGRGGGRTLSFRTKSSAVGGAPDVYFLGIDPAEHQGPAFALAIKPVLDSSDCLRRQNGP